MRHAKEKRCREKRNRSLPRIFCLVFLVSFLAANLSGCTCYRPLRLPQLREFEQNVLRKYPLSMVSCKYAYEDNVTITVSGASFDEECAYTILGYLKPIVCDEDFIQDLFDFYERQFKDRPNWGTWKSGWRPDINVYLNAMGRYSKYRFSTSANKEAYNSGYDPDSYTWDGYTTWYGTEYVDSVPREISPEEIEEALERYS